MYKCRFFLWLITSGVAVSALSGCAHVASESPPPATLNSGEVVYRTQTFIGSCAPGSESALLATIAASAISQGVTKIGEAIKAAAQTETVTDSNRQNIEISRAAKLGPCITVIRGWFYRNPPNLSTANTAAFYSNSNSLWPYARGNLGDFWQHGMAIAATPDFYFRGLIVLSSDKSMYAIQPREATLDEPLSTTALRPGGERHVTVSFAIDKNVVDLNKSPGATLVLGKMRPGKKKQFANQRCVYVDGDNPIDCKGAKNVTIYSNELSNWFSVPLDDSMKPLHLQTLITETRDPSKFLEFVSAIFSDSTVKTALTTAAQETVIPSVRQSAENVEKSTQRKADNDFDKAWQDARTALQACVKDPENPNIRLAARSALRSAISAAANASDEYRGPFHATDSNAIGIQPVDVSATKCQDALDLI